ncbi:MAG: ATP-dependent sacrificial sulfur transferase LarE [Lachnospiraceae bacterium]|nr:ATP-dependent sacrificial sulfur transferase LarE [Lachnospiraceae bacterium]
MIDTNVNLSDEQKTKLQKLKDIIADLGSVAVGFSGGVDSTLLLYTAHEVLGKGAVAITENSASMPGREIGETEAFCKEHGIRQFFCTVDPLSIDEFRNNAPDRCYHCKRLIFSEIKRIAEEIGIAHVAEGSNTDDMGDYRPGMRAIEELGIKSPLREAGLGKEDIRMLSRALGLPTWSKPAYACLATRIASGEEITEDKLRMIDKAEQFLIENGFLEERVRMHGDLARIEVPSSVIERLASKEIREKVYEYLKGLGFRYVTIDAYGYKMGSMNGVPMTKNDI